MEKIFTSTHPVELFQVIDEERKPLVTGQHLELLTVPGTRAYPVLSARAITGATQWDLKIGTHVMRSKSTAGEPTYIFSSVVDNNPDLFYCVIFQRNTPAQELVVLEQILSKLTTLHQSEHKPSGPNLPLPQIDPKQVNEIMRKGAEDTQMLLNQAGKALHDVFLAGVEMHKKYAPKPADKPVEVNPEVKDKLAKTKQATAAGAAVAKGVATGLQAATSEIGTSLAQTVTCATGGSKGCAAGRSGNPGGEGVAQAPVKPAMAAAAGLGGIGVELLRDIAAVRDAMVAAAGTAWQGAREATVEVMNYQYGNQVGSVTADACDVAEGIGAMGVAMTYVQPGQVVLSSAKDSKDKAAGRADAAQAGDTLKRLEEERAALEREKAALAAERAALDAARVQQQPPVQQQAQAQQQRQQQHKFAFGWT